MRVDHRLQQKQRLTGFNQESVRSGPLCAVDDPFSQDGADPKKKGWYPGKAPFGGDRAAERAFVASLRVARRMTDGREFRALPGEATAP